jgi:hypothetical protein
LGLLIKKHNSLIDLVGVDHASCGLKTGQILTLKATDPGMSRIFWQTGNILIYTCCILFHAHCTLYLGQLSSVLSKAKPLRASKFVDTDILMLSKLRGGLVSNIGAWGVGREMVVCAILLQSGRDDVRCVSNRFTGLFAGCAARCGSRCGDLQRKRSTNWRGCPWWW